MTRFLIAVIHLYQWVFSGMKPVPSCRFAPTCSSYAIEALSQHGAMRGSFLALRRILRCHPWGGHGLDPVPPLPSSQVSS
jgi:putative membrane protein insertion efficiency factor